MPYVRLIPLGRCRKEGGTFVTFQGRELAVFRFGEPERVVITDNSCPHAGGNLSGGELSGGVVTCPWHEWKFDLAGGACVHSPTVRVRTYPTQVRDGSVWIDLTGGIEDNATAQA